ncbi:MAG: ABC transporter ATP-binding protein/permease [Pseudomonadota bacterium]|nr:ABC transporter ATP-binding protein/permease [Pseudomonadota bacterium]
MWRDFLSCYRPHRRLLIGVFGAASLSGVLELGFPMAVRAFVDRLLPQADLPPILVAIALLLLLYLGNAALLAVVTYWGHVLGVSIETELRRRAFDHLHALSMRFFDRETTGHVVSRITTDLADIGEVAHHGPEDLLVALLTFLGAFALMLLVSWKLALVAIAVVPMATWLIAHYGARMDVNARAQFRRIGRFNARVEENVGGARVVQAFANEAHERARFATENDSYRREKLGAYRLITTSLTLNYLSMRLVQIVVMLGGTVLIVRGGLSIGDFVAFLLLVSVFYRPLDKIGTMIEIYPRGLAGFRRFRDLLATAPDVQDEPGAADAPELQGDIAFEQVRFGYEPGQPVLDGFDLRIAAGETVAIVGPSGAGKTTLCALLPRFYDVQAGRITIDGIDIRSVRRTSLRRQIGIVEQSVFLFAGTIRDNVGYGRLGASEVEIADAIRRARLEEFVASLPDGLDTEIGERGARLSGGQRQRIAIARIFLKNPPILILDEATSALDSETERLIQRSLAELAEGRTTLVIAHRLATIRGADRIVVLSPQGVLEQGPHATLLANDGPYRRLHEAQFGQAAAE